MQSPQSLFQPLEWLGHSDTFISEVFSKAHKSKAVIAVSGGIDSAVALNLLVRALGAKSVIGVCLPYGDQDMTDAELVMAHVGLPASARLSYNIKPIVLAASGTVKISTDNNAESSQLRLGNLMARSRMMVMFDLAKKLNALVCGTENKTEHYLGYFTRFGDAASDLEPITGLYKTQVRQVAQELGLPEIFLSKSPSAGLWQGQTDEVEMGFKYVDADLVLTALIDQKIPRSQIASITKLNQVVVNQVLAQIDRSIFKLQVPYTPSN